MSTADQTPWMAMLDPATREAVQANVSRAPALTERQKERLRLLFRDTSTEGSTDRIPVSRSAQA